MSVLTSFCTWVAANGGGTNRIDTRIRRLAVLDIGLSVTNAEQQTRIRYDIGIIPGRNLNAAIGHR